MIYFDLTKTGGSSHRSGLMRVSGRLAGELGEAATGVQWGKWNREVQPADWFVTAELFSEAERPGFTAFLDARRCRLAAIFHDAIPLKLPHITWPQSVARHPGYLKLLAKFDRVWAVSEASRQELVGFWRWLGLERTPPVTVLPLGADFNGARRVTSRGLPATAVPQLLGVGIIEPRKNQMLLLDACETLWRVGLKFELNLVGRVNPHFGAPIMARAKRLARTHRGTLRIHQSASDAVLTQLHGSARATVFPTIAEGCGLPLLESLWMGVPCVFSDLAVLRENGDGGGCVPVAVNDLMAWQTAIRRVVEDDAFVATLTAEAATRSLPTWAKTAETLRAGLL